MKHFYISEHLFEDAECTVFSAETAEKFDSIEEIISEKEGTFEVSEITSLHKNELVRKYRESFLFAKDILVALLKKEGVKNLKSLYLKQYFTSDFCGKDKWSKKMLDYLNNKKRISEIIKKQKLIIKEKCIINLMSDTEKLIREVGIKDEEINIWLDFKDNGEGYSPFINITITKTEYPNYKSVYDMGEVETTTLFNGQAKIIDFNLEDACQSIYGFLVRKFLNITKD